MSTTVPDPVVAVPGPFGEPEVPDAEGMTVEARSYAAQTWQRFRRHKPAMVSAVVLVLLVASFWVVPMLSPFDSTTRNIREAAQGISRKHPFGTDEIGRDLLVRTMEGAQVSVRVALIVSLISTAIGTVLGALAGYFGKLVDSVINQVINMILVVPALVVLLVMGIKIGGSINQTALLLAFISWIVIARIVRGLFFQLKEAEFVQAARAAGAGPVRIIFRHIMPNVIGPVLVQVTLVAGTAIILESTLSFLSLGVDPPATSLGTLISDAKGFFDTRPSRILIPGGILTVMVLCLNFLGDGLRDALDPTSRKVRE
ncbi:MAG: ABC transporter permease [Actinomyces sp.]|nr:MAG: ABC transporter permease [Actinomyces sp.]